MNKIFRIAFASCVAMGLSLDAFAQDIDLPAPDKKGGKPLNEALSERKTGREYSDRELTPQELSNLLWAANGLNRDSGGRTAPTARDAQEIEIYVILKSGIYLYADSKLKLVLAEDVRKLAGQQPFTWTAPVNLIYVMDYDKQDWGDAGRDIKREYAAVDSGFIGQNVYLHCASTGMATVFRGMVDRAKLKEKLKLPDNKEVLYGQTVGFPKT